MPNRYALVSIASLQRACTYRSLWAPPRGRTDFSVLLVRLPGESLACNTNFTESQTMTVILGNSAVSYGFQSSHDTWATRKLGLEREDVQADVACGGE
jgi:hypothetical protein